MKHENRADGGLDDQMFGEMVQDSQNLHRTRPQLCSNSWRRGEMTTPDVGTHGRSLNITHTTGL